MLAINNLTMFAGPKLLFSEANLILNKGKRYALTGANGSGKTTLLKLLWGEETPSDGDISIPKNSVIGWLKQDQFRYENDRLVDIVIRGKQHLWEALCEKEELLTAPEFDEKAGLRLGLLEEIIAHQNGYMAESAAQKLLTGLGISIDYHFKPLSSLSGGYKLRVLLAQTLFSDPDILLLDEPTNHLDIMTIVWLEKYLINEFKGLLLFVSHDVNFINNLATNVVDIDYGEIRLYHGNYQSFMQEKQNLVQQKLQEHAILQKRIEHLQQFVVRFRAKASKARQAKSKEKMIEKIQLPDIEKSSRIAPSLSFKQARPSGKTVLTVKNLAKNFIDKIVLQNINFNVQRGEKIAIIGHNGIGKSTLLKILVNQFQAEQGHFEWGYEAQISYFAQDHHELLNQSSTVLSWLTKHINKVTDSQIRNVLGQVLFTKDEVMKDVLTLSGGEAARLLLAKIMLEQANIIILDEPTNHLDIEAIDALAEALKNFQGTLLLVSHDRYFVSKMTTRVIALTEKGIKDFKGSYQEYLKYYGDDYLSREWLASSTK